MKYWGVISAVIVAFLFLAATDRFLAATDQNLPACPTTTPTPTPTATVTQCPQATPESLWVDPVTSPTELLTQTIVVGIGNGEAVTATTESGEFAIKGSFDAFFNPAKAAIDLLPDQTHHLYVAARVRKVEQWGCIYGGYTLYTERDRYGGPLIIVQRNGALETKLFIPLVLQGGFP